MSDEVKEYSEKIRGKDGSEVLLRCGAPSVTYHKLWKMTVVNKAGVPIYFQLGYVVMPLLGADVSFRHRITGSMKRLEKNDSFIGPRPLVYDVNKCRFSKPGVYSYLNYTWYPVLFVRDGSFDSENWKMETLPGWPSTRERDKDVSDYAVVIKRNSKGLLETNVIGTSSKIAGFYPPRFYPSQPPHLSYYQMSRLPKYHR